MAASRNRWADRSQRKQNDADVNQECDFLIIGGGVIGINLALQAKRRYPDSRVMVIDKEPQFGLHASGRNSGVLHAGFYYTADSLKARFTRDGNRELTQYCLERGLKINRCGKLVVAKNEMEVETLQVLLDRAANNGVELREVTAKEAKEIEPRAITCEKALFSPSTASVDPQEVMASLVNDAGKSGIVLQTNVAYSGRADNGIQTNRGDLRAKYVINAAGLYADRIAKDYGFCKQYTIIPFKGLYLVGDEPKGAFKTHIYPVPDLRHPFLGVHVTINVHGKIKLGPTAIPAFWREHYQGLENFNYREMCQIVWQELNLFIRNDFGFRRIAFEEITKYHVPTMTRLASELASGISAARYGTRGPSGLRAQLFDIQSKRLEMDFKYEGDAQSFHVLNAVSPAFTCAMPFSRHLFDAIERCRAG